MIENYSFSVQTAAKASSTPEEVMIADSCVSNFSNSVMLRENNYSPQGKEPSVSDEATLAAMQSLYDRLSPNVHVIGDLTDQLLLRKHSTSWAYDPEEEALSKRLMSVQCIASDDPRLKGISPVEPI